MQMSIEFQPWPKIARLNRDIVVTEKIDGTNAAIQIMRADPSDSDGEGVATCVLSEDGQFYKVAAQSRSRLIVPGADNFGFASWVVAHAETLAATLGEGVHFGEWWGSGIQRGYDQPKGLKHFSLFNTHRHRDVDLAFETQHGVSRVRPVPVLRQWGRFDAEIIDEQLYVLQTKGSEAAPGFMRPEGVVVFHTAAQTMFTVLLEGDDRPKGATP